MEEIIIATKGNLLSVKKSFTLAKMGFSLMDKERNILVRELLEFTQAAKTLRHDIK